LFLSDAERRHPVRHETLGAAPWGVKQGQAVKGVYTKRESVVRCFIHHHGKTSHGGAFFDITVTQVDPVGTTTFEHRPDAGHLQESRNFGIRNHTTQRNPSRREEYLRSFNGHRFKVVLSAEVD
jgi:hypothetical protein